MRIKKIKKLLEKEEGYKAGLFAQKVREVCDNWFYANENILRKDFEVDYTRSLDDCFLIRNPYNNYETPVMEIYLLKPQKNRFLFFKQKSLIMARIRLVGLFLTDEKPIFEVADKESLEVATSQKLVYKAVEGIIKEAVLFEKLSNNMKFLFTQESYYKKQLEEEGVIVSTSHGRGKNSPCHLKVVGVE